MGQLLSTDVVAPQERLAYWNDAICDVYVQLECDALRPDEPFDGRIRHDRLGTLELSRVTSRAQRVVHGPRQIARATEDRCLVSLQTRGRGTISQDGRDAVLEPGDFALYDATRPYTLRFDGPFEQIVVMLPGPVLRSQLRDSARLTATTVAGGRGAGHLAIGMIETLARDVEQLEPGSAAAVADAVTHILVAGLRTLPAAREGGDVSNLVALHRERIRAHVRAHLRDPALGVGSIAQALRMSPSSVHRAFQGEPVPVSHWILGLRLDAIRRDLADPALAHRPVSAIAFDWGFNDAAHFSRAYRERFGCAPRDSRARAADPGARDPAARGR
jgi:AraC-like DNA-binding protein